EKAYQQCFLRDRPCDLSAAHTERFHNAYLPSAFRHGRVHSEQNNKSAYRRRDTDEYIQENIQCRKPGHIKFFEVGCTNDLIIGKSVQDVLAYLIDRETFFYRNENRRGLALAAELILHYVERQFYAGSAGGLISSD